ncbi:MAG: ricin-type beta-trefoil lectin domain protein [Myxococcales bacterium]
MKKAPLGMVLVWSAAVAMLTFGCDGATVSHPDALAVYVPDAATDSVKVDVGADAGPVSGTGGRGGNLSSSGGTGSGGLAGIGGTAGSSAVAGASGTGGAPTTGGASGSSVGGAGGRGGMTTASGGATPATGGRANTGGAAGTGGVVSTGGAPATGGRVGTGGTATGGSGTGGRGTGGSSTGGSGTGGTVPQSGASLYVVAHPDDELLFMNPDLETDIQSGRPVVTIYVTSGDGGDPNSAWRARETSGMAAHAAMAGVASNWLCGGATYGGKTTTRCTLPARDGLVIVLLRVVDGTVPSTTSTGAIATIDKAATYTPAELMATLAAIQTQVAPVKVGTMDGTLAHGSDHQDHIAVGVLMFDVARADGVARTLAMYRGYSMFEPAFATGMLPTPEPVNLTAAQYQEKLRIISVYEPPPLDAPFDEWCHRMYAARMVTGASAPVHTSAGSCLQASGTADGASVTVATCNGAASQNWTVGTNSHVVASGGRCLAVATGGTAAVLRTCNNASADQRWTLLSNGQLRGTALTCLTFTGSSVSAMACGSDTSQPLYSPPASQRWAR